MLTKPSGKRAIMATPSASKKTKRLTPVNAAEPNRRSEAHLHHDVFRRTGAKGQQVSTRTGNSKRASTASSSAPKKKVRLALCALGVGTGGDARQTTVHLHPAVFQRPGPKGQKKGDCTSNYYLLITPRNKTLNKDAMRIINQSACAFGEKMSSYNYNKELQAFMLRVITPEQAQRIYDELCNNLEGGHADLRAELDVVTWKANDIPNIEIITINDLSRVDATAVSRPALLLKGKTYHISPLLRKMGYTWEKPLTGLLRIVQPDDDIDELERVTIALLAEWGFRHES
jgi:hypothetical protein